MPRTAGRASGTQHILRRCLARSLGRHCADDGRREAARVLGIRRRVMQFERGAERHIHHEAIAVEGDVLDTVVDRKSVRTAKGFLYSQYLIGAIDDALRARIREYEPTALPGTA